MKLSRLYGRFSVFLAAPDRMCGGLGYRTVFGSGRYRWIGGYLGWLGDVLVGQRSPYGGNSGARKSDRLKLAKCFRGGYRVCICWFINLITGEIPDSAGPVFLRLYVCMRDELGML